jgi:hypothetical protein
MRIGIGKKIGSVYVGVSKTFGGKSKGGGGCLGAIAVLFALPFILIYGFVVAVIALIKKIAECTKEWDIKHKIILWVSIGGGFLILVVIGCIVSPPQSGGDTDSIVASKSTTISTSAASPKAYDPDDLWITEAETTSAHTTTTAIVTSEPEEEEETEPAIAETDTSEYEESNAENEEAQENSDDEATVYITNTGKCYHYNSHCGSGNYFEVSLDEALGMGLKPCKKCVE